MPTSKSYELISATLLLLFLTITPDRVVQASCCGEGELEICFIIDSSSSMNHTLSTLQEQSRRMLEALRGRFQHLRGAVVIFRTYEYTGPLQKIAQLSFTQDEKELNAFLTSQRAEGGGEEMIIEAFEAALALPWTKGARKVAILLGDEHPREASFAKCRKLAQQFTERGIILHTVTASQTAWIYWAPLNQDAWQQRVSRLGQEAKRTFELPFFQELAAIGQGISVSSWNSRELILWLLAFGLGMNKDQALGQIDMNRFMEWSKAQDEKDAFSKQTQNAVPHLTVGSLPGFTQEQAGLPMLGWLKHQGHWQAPHMFPALLSHLGQRLQLSGPPRVDEVELLTANLMHFPILYLTGKGPIRWSHAEKKALKRHLESGATLIADACCGDEAFNLSLQQLCLEFFPNNPLETLPREHPIFDCGHEIDVVLRSAKACTGRLEKTSPRLDGLYLPSSTSADARRLAIIHSPYDLGGSWQATPFSLPTQHDHESGLKLSANILLWVLTH